MHARTLRAYSPAQDLHVDFERDAVGFLMVGFIFMLDDFRLTTEPLALFLARTRGRRFRMTS